MKSIVRTFALSLVVTGAFASAHLAKTNAGISAPVRVSAVPPAGCPLNDPNACGMKGN